MTVTAAEFARLAGVSKPAITKALAAGRVVKGPTGIDTENPVNAIYLATAHGTGGARPAPAKPAAKVAPAAKKKSPRKPKAVDPDDAAFQKAVRVRQVKKAARAQIAATDSGDEDLSDLDPEDRAAREKIKATIADLMGETADLDIKKKKVDIALKISMERRHTLKFAQDKGLVVKRESVKRAFALMNASITTNILQVPRAAVPNLFAMARSGASTQDGIVALEKILGLAVSRVVEETASAI